MNQYCKLFIDADIAKRVLVGRIIEWVGGSSDKNSILTSWGEIDVEENEFFNKTKREALPDGFLFFRYYLDIEPTMSTSHETYVAGIADLLNKASEGGFRCVAACDFEEVLPRHGGIAGNI